MKNIRVARVLWALFFVILFFGASSLHAQTALVINPNGGDNSAGTDGIKIVVSQTGNIMLFKYGQKQKWSSAAWDGNPNNSAWNSGMFLGLRFNRPGDPVNNTRVNMTFCSKTDISGAGSDADPYVLRIQGTAISPISGKMFYITIVISYAYPNNYYIADYYVRAPFDLAIPEEVHFYMWQDDYIVDGSGSINPNPDTGYGFIGPIVSGTSRSLVGNYNIYGTHSIKVDGLMQSYYVGGPHASGGDQPVTDLYYNNYQGTSFSDIDICVHFSTPAIGAGQMAVRRMLRGITGPNTTGTFESTPVVAPTVTPDPSTPVSVNFVSPTVNEQEGDVDHTAGGIRIRVAGGVLAVSQVLTFYIAGASAVQNTDYTYLDGFTIPVGDYTTPQEFDIPNFTVKGNLIAQNNRMIIVGMRTNCNDLIGIGPDNRCTYTILDDDSYRANIAAVRGATEGDVTTGRFRVWLTNGAAGNAQAPALQDITLTFSTAGSTASPADYTWTTAGVTANQFTIPAGTSELYLDFTAASDLFLEGTENLSLTLVSAVPSKTAVSSIPVTLNILDATDGTIIVNPNPTDAAEPSTNGLFQICFKVAGVTAVRDINVDYTISGTAVNGTDYQLVSPNPATIQAGSHCVDIPVNVIDNNKVEGTRNVTITITNVAMP